MSEPIRLEYTVPGDDFARAGEASADLKATLKKLGLRRQEELIHLMKNYL